MSVCAGNQLGRPEPVEGQWALPKVELSVCLSASSGIRGGLAGEGWSTDRQLQWGSQDSYSAT